jgi:tetratricopeptide (TPR) repeat protein
MLRFLSGSFAVALDIDKWRKSKTFYRVIAAVSITLALLSWMDIYRRQKIAEAVDHVKRGVAHFNSKEYDEAITEYQAALRLDPNLSMAHNGIGSALDREHKNIEAVAEYREALRLDPTNFIAHTNLGDALHVKGDLDGALTQYTEAARLKPDSALAHNNVGSVLFEKRDYGGALEQLKTAVRLDPNLANAHLNLAWTFRCVGDSRVAVAECQKARELAPADPLIQKSCTNLDSEVGSGPAKNRPPA